MKINIPHLNYSIQVIYKPHKESNGLPCCERVNKSKCILWIPEKYKNLVTLIAHETMHVLQFIAEDRGIDMIREQEHMAYLMQYIMAELLGYKLVTI